MELFFLKRCLFNCFIMKLNEEQARRYNRHILLPGVGEGGQRKISEAKVLVIGSGGLGSPVLLYLAAAGVGTLGIADSDVVDISNLQRQIIHTSEDIDKEKPVSAREKICKLNPDVSVNTHIVKVDSKNILELISGYDFIVDGTDNFDSKFLINDACVIAGKPFSHAGVLQFTGQSMTVLPGKTTCYRCVFKEAPSPDAVKTSSEVGILGSVAGMLGILQATEVLKFIIGKGNLLTDCLMIFDALEMEFRKVKVKMRKNCPACGESGKITSLIDYENTLQHI